MPLKPLVSVITPSYNSAEFLEETIHSVLSQDYPEIEYIVMDAGSTDGSQAILDRYKGRLLSISRPDDGAADAINRGFGLSRGTILAWLGADDKYLPGAISTAVQHLLSNPDAAVLYGQGYWIDECGKRLGSYPTAIPYCPSMFRRRCCICQPATFIRRDAVEAIGGLNATLHSAFDYDLWIRLAKRFPFAACPNFLAESRMHQRNKSLGQKEVMFEEAILVLRRHYDYVPVNWVYGYLSFLRDRTDQFFTPMRHSPTVYVRSLFVGSRLNSRHLCRYWSEWASSITRRVL